MSQSDIDWMASLGSGGPKQASVVIQANPKWASTVTNRVEPYKSLPAKFAPALQAVADYITKTTIPRTFKAEGPGWRQLSKRTQHERAAKGYDPKHPILVRSGDLLKELTDKSHPNHIEIIRTGQYARVTVGGSSEKFIRNQLGNQSLNIPSRPMMPGKGRPLSPDDDQAIRKLITQKIQEAMKT